MFPNVSRSVFITGRSRCEEMTLQKGVIFVVLSGDGQISDYQQLTNYLLF